MLRLSSDGPECLWDLVLPPGVHLLPDDLRRLDLLLADQLLLKPFSACWELNKRRAGRPTIAMATYLRLMVIKHRQGWGYESLVKEVGDSLHLRRFCLIPLTASVPDESTIRKLTRRLGPELVDELIRSTITLAMSERGFRVRAMRCDSTVVEADIRFPTDSGLTADAVRTLARVARRVRAAVPNATQHVRDRTTAVGKRLRMLGRSLRRRTGEAKEAVERLTKEAAAQVQTSIREAHRLLAQAQDSRQPAPGVSPKLRERTIEELATVISRAERLVEQVRMRFAGEKIPDRLLSFFDPDARPVRRGKLAHPNEFGYVVQLTEVNANTKRGARGLILPPKLSPGSTHDNALLPLAASDLERLGMAPREAAFDGGFTVTATYEAMEPTATLVFIAGQRNSDSAHTNRRLACYRVGCEGRISHLKREYGSRRSRLKGLNGARTWSGWSVLAYNLDTVAYLES